MTNYGGQRRQGGGGARSPGGSSSGAPPARGTGSGRSRGGGHHDQPEDKVANYWPDYLKDGYFDANGNLRVEYVSRDKHEPLVKSMCQSHPGLTTHQVRRYFGHCRTIETRIKATRATWASVWPEVKKLDVAAADGRAKQPPKIPPLFHDFIQRNVVAINSEKDFLDGFLPHFEALVGFGQAHFRKDRS